MRISAVIITKNEEKNIRACLETLQWCDEIVMIDDHSSDKTVRIAEKYKAKIYQHVLDNNFSQQRNFGLQKAIGDWVLFVDADERISPSLRDEIIQYANKQIIEYKGFYIKRLDSMWGRVLKYGETGNIRLLRLAKKNSGEWRGKVHEVWDIKGSVGELAHPMMHFPHQTLTEFLTEINFYTTLRAQELFDQNVKVFWLAIIAYPKVKFIQNYIVRRGFLDGIAGLVFALCMTLHSFLVRAKVWYLWQKK